jgi:5-methylcytosine-specific restriction endonuclease McrA
MDMTCDNDCYYRKGNYTCSIRESLSIGNDGVRINVVKILVKNVSEKLIRLPVNRFELIDSFGFTHCAKRFCDTYFKDRRPIVSSYEIPPGVQIYYNLVTDEFEESAVLSKIGFTDDKFYSLDILNKPPDDSNSLEFLKIENARLKTENDKFKERLKILDRSVNESVKYKTETEDSYFYVISDEKNYTISFNREFDKSKGNYNWIDKGDALITMRRDNTEYYMNCPTKIESPVSGVFEYDKNKLIQCGEVICRIKIYDPSRKQEVIEKLEEEDIRQAVIKKERKKKIEREVLDDLISRGIVFNSYTTRSGNRSAIPIDIANAVWNRDGGKCVYCGAREKLEFDHIIPASKGGSSTYRNLQLLCENCNREKSDKIG